MTPLTDEARRGSAGRGAVSPRPRKESAPIELTPRMFDFQWGPSGMELLPGHAVTVHIPDLHDGITKESAGRHYLVIVDQNGNVIESVLLTAVVETTIAFTPSQPHSAGWSLRSATAGLQEAFYYSQTLGLPCRIHIPRSGSLYTLYATLFLYGWAGNSVMITGEGTIASRIARSPLFPVGDLIHYDGTVSNGDLTLADFGILNTAPYSINTAGSAIHIREAFACHLSRLAVTDGFRQLRLEGTGALIRVTDCEFRYTKTYLSSALSAGTLPEEQILVNCATVSFTGNEVVQDASAELAVVGVRITRGDGHTFENNRIGGLDGFQISHNGRNPLNFVYIRNNVINGLWRFGIHFTDAPSNGQEFHNFILANNDIISQFQYPDGPSQHAGINATNPLLVGVEVAGNIISGWGFDGIRVKDGKHWNIHGNTIRDCNASYTVGSGIHLLGEGVGNCVTGNYSGFQIVDGAGIPRNPFQTAGLYISGRQQDLLVTGNNFKFNKYPIVYAADPSVTGVISKNVGVDEVVTYAFRPSYTLRIGIYPFIQIAGTAIISEIAPGPLNTLVEGAEYLILSQSGTTFDATGSATLGNSITLGPNQMAVGKILGGRMFLK